MSTLAPGAHESGTCDTFTTDLRQVTVHVNRYFDAEGPVVAITWRESDGSYSDIDLTPAEALRLSEAIAKAARA